ncbi:MAG: twitching motility protein PilT [Candidatus Omnitrophica bacterium]|nr:twitching motility protein PilT [Candidatus Omnitrophota bacterium]
MTVSFIRCFFVILSGALGYYVGFLKNYPLLGTEIGLLSSLLLIFIESRCKGVSVRGLSSMVFGLLLGIFMAKIISDILQILPLGEFVHSVTKVVLTIIFSYLGAIMALRGKDEFNIIIPYVRFKRQDVKEGVILLDTSAIIDGRAIDIYKVHFLAGRLVVPSFVLRELQQLSDSADDMKRQRGRRGTEILHSMQEDPKIDLHIHEDDSLEKQGVDDKLIRLAKIMDGRICTVDYNLGRVALLQDVQVLNPHELVMAVKPVVFTGEELQVYLVKEGKEHDQAVAFLEDGTMVVVKNAKTFIGQNIIVQVTTVLQTQSGKMIFAKIKDTFREA